MAFKMKMTLRGIEPKVTRTVTIPEDSRISDLHPVIDKLMGWSGDGAYAFYIPRTGTYSTPADKPLTGDFEATGDVDAALSSMDKVPFRYIYRQDENWMVDVEFQKDSTEPDYTILKWQGDAPCEGHGGPAAYRKDRDNHPVTPFDAESVASSLIPPDVGDGSQKTTAERLDPMDLPEGVVADWQVTQLSDYMTSELGCDVYYIPSVRSFVEVEVDSVPGSADAIPAVMAEECLGLYTAETFIKAAAPDMGIAPDTVLRLKAFDPESSGMDAFHSFIENEGLSDKWDSTRSVMGERIARQWLNDNGFKVHGEEGGPLETPNSLDFVSVLMTKVDQMFLDANALPCRNCGNPCHGTIDRSLPPTLVSKIPHHAARIHCDACGTDSVICLINDGYRRNYAFQTDRMVYPNYLKQVELQIRSRIEEDPRILADIMADMAVEYNKVSEHAGSSAISLEAIEKLNGMDLMGEDFELYYKVVSIAGMSNLSNTRAIQMHIDRLKRRIDKMHGIYGAAFAVVCAFMSTSLKAIRNYADKAVAMMSEVEGYDWFKLDLMEGLAVCILREHRGDETALGLLEEAFRQLIGIAPESDIMGPSTSLKQLARVFEIYMGQLEIAGDVARAEAALDLMEETFPFQDSPEGTMVIMWLFRRAVHEILIGGDPETALSHLNRMDEACLRTMELGTYATSRRCYAAALMCICGRADERILLDSIQTMMSMFELKSISYIEILAFVNVFSACAKERFETEKVAEMVLSTHRSATIFMDMIEKVVFDRNMLLAYEDIFLT